MIEAKSSRRTKTKKEKADANADATGWDGKHVPAEIVVVVIESVRADKT